MISASSFSKKILLTSIFLLVASSLFAVTISQGVYADQALERLCAPYRNDVESAPEVCQTYFVNPDPTPGGEGDGIVAFLREVIGIFSLVVGIASVIAIIVGGLLYITSAGDPQKATKARNTIIYSVVGIVVAVLSQAIIFFVLDRLDGATEENGDESSIIYPHQKDVV